MIIDSTTMDSEETYKLLTGVVVPRPIAWVCSGTEPGKTNLAPFSTFTFVSQFPPMVGFNCGRRAGRQKDTSVNINAAKEFVVNIADEPMLEALHFSSEYHPPEVSEVTLLNLETAPSKHIKTPRLAAAPISMECKLHQTLRFGSVGSEFFVGEVVAFHVRDSLYEDGKIDTAKLRPVCRVAGPRYGTVGEIVTMKIIPT